MRAQWATGAICGKLGAFCFCAHSQRGIEMSKMICAAVAAAAVLGFAGAAEAKCFQKSSSGTDTTLEGAKFQAHEAILQSFDVGSWAVWMLGGGTPGYKVSPRYSCSKGGLGYNCRATATICKS
jgi:hypothetical protein